MLSDEEKAEEYGKQWCELCDLKTKDRCKSICFKVEVSTQDYLEGLAEGRKGKCLEQNKDGTILPCEVIKENEELKKYIAKLEYLIRHHTDFIPIEGNGNGDMYGLWKSIKMKIGMLMGEVK